MGFVPNAKLYAVFCFKDHRVFSIFSQCVSIFHMKDLRAEGSYRVLVKFPQCIGFHETSIYIGDMSWQYIPVSWFYRVPLMPQPHSSLNLLNVTEAPAVKESLVLVLDGCVGGVDGWSFFANMEWRF